MEIHQIPLQTLTNTDINIKGVWNKKWIRPFESLWSIINNYKKVNVINEHSVALKSLGFHINPIVKSTYVPKYGIYCNLSQTKNDIDNIIFNLVPDWYIEQIQIWTMKQGVSCFISEMIRYCPKCMENGYHSILHQLKGIRRCPFHPNSYLISYLKQRYVLGRQSDYKGAQTNRERTCVFWGRQLTSNYIDFDNISILPLPTDWKNMPEIEDYFQKNVPRTDFNYIRPIGTDIYDEDIPPAIGEFLLKPRSSLKPDIILFNQEESDRLAIKKIVNRFKKCGLKQTGMSDYGYNLHMKQFFSQILIVEMLDGFTNDEIQYKCYQIETGKLISYNDELGKRLLFLLFLTGNERTEECLPHILEAKEITERSGLSYSYIPSDICIHALNINGLCTSAQYYIVDEFIRMNWKVFQKFFYKTQGLRKPINYRDLIIHQIHFIYEEKDNHIYIYRVD